LAKLSEKTKDVGLRISPDLHEKLKESALKNRRSINSEIIIALEMMFSKDEKLTESEQTLFEKIKSLPLEERKAIIKKLSGGDE
jgi:hypothetical protein